MTFACYLPRESHSQVYAVMPCFSLRGCYVDGPRVTVIACTSSWTDNMARMSE